MIHQTIQLGKRGLIRFYSDRFKKSRLIIYRNRNFLLPDKYPVPFDMADHGPIDHEGTVNTDKQD